MSAQNGTAKIGRRDARHADGAEHQREQEGADENNRASVGIILFMIESVVTMLVNVSGAVSSPGMACVACAPSSLMLCRVADVTWVGEPALDLRDHHPGLQVTKSPGS